MMLSNEERARIHAEERERAYSREQRAMYQVRQRQEATAEEAKRLEYIERHGGPDATGRHIVRKWLIAGALLGIISSGNALHEEGLLAAVQVLILGPVIGFAIGLYRAKKVISAD